MSQDIVVITGRGKVHKAIRDFRGKVVGHPRCHVSADVRVLGTSAASADPDLLAHPFVYCRYRWCFRDELVAMGLDPAVGHTSRPFRWRPKEASHAHE